MYVPAHFSVGDAEALIVRLARRGAALLVTVDAGGSPIATHLPILWDGDKSRITGHVARANPHWLAGGGRALVVLNGADAYVSPGFYPSKSEHGRVVPTWNYEAVHLSGTCEWFDDAARLEAIVRDLSALHEQNMARPWSIDDAPRDYIERLLNGIVGVTVQIDRIEAKRKVSQNKDAADYAGVMTGLLHSGDARALEVAAIMRGRSKR